MALCVSEYPDGHIFHCEFSCKISSLGFQTDKHFSETLCIVIPHVVITVMLLHCVPQGHFNFLTLEYKFVLGTLSVEELIRDKLK